MRWFVAILLFCPLLAWADTHVSSSTTWTAVSNALYAASDGDEVIVTNGSSTWAGTLVIDKRVRLRGKGIGNTTITGTSGTKMMVIESGTAYLEISGFSFIEAGTHNASDGTWDFNGGNWRFCSNSVVCSDGGAGLAVWHTDVASTLIDRNWVTVASGSASAHFVLFYGTYSDGGSNSWKYGTTYGTTNYCVVEHNTIIWSANAHRDGIFDGFAGAKFVIRFNTFTNAYFGWHGTDTGGYWSPHSFEIYGNQFWFTGDGHYCLFNSRGGTGLVFSNVVQDVTGDNVELQYYRYDPGPCGDWGCMSESNPWDGGEDSTGYPGLTQPGMTGPVTFGGGHSSQVKSPMYFWQNSANMSVGYNPSSIEDIVKPGRDWTNVALSGYVPLANPHPMAGYTLEDDETPPTISNLSSNAGTTNFTITFGTSEAAYSGLAWGTTTDYGSTVTNTSLLTSHSLVATNLITNTVYHWKVWATDSSGNQTNSADYTVTTLTNASDRVTNFYVSTTGSDSAAGTISAPWLTLQTSIDKMLTNLGCTLWVRGGRYAQGNNPDIDNFPATNTPTRFMGYPGETVLIDLGGTSAGAAGMTNSWNIWWSDMILSNGNSALEVTYCGDIVLSNITGKYVGQHAFHIYNLSRDVLAVDCTAADTGQGSSNAEGFYVGAQEGEATHNITIRGCTIYNVQDEAVEFKPGSYSNIVENCTIHDGSQSTSEGAIEIDEDTSYGANPNHIIRNNVIYNVGTVASGWDYGIHIRTGAKVYNNVIYSVDAASYGIYADNPEADSWPREVYNNTVDHTAALGIVRSAGTWYCTNNIGTNAGPNLAVDSAYFVDYAGHNYALTNGAAAIGAGADLSATFTTDVIGNTRSGTWDVGAYEYQGATAAPRNMRVLGTLRVTGSIRGQ